MSLHCIDTIKKIFILLCFFSGIFFCAHAAAPDSLFPFISYKHFGEEDGLKCKTVYEAIQDKNGFMWFSTDAGVFRFDGRIFKRYSTDDGIEDNEVLKICQDHYGRIWFLTLNGKLSFWKDGKIYNALNTPFLKNAFTGGSTLSHYEDTHGRLWIGTDRYGFIVIDGDSVSKVKYPLTSMTHYIYEDSKGEIWTFNDNKMFMYPDNKSNDTILISAPVRNFSACHNKTAGFDFFYLSKGKVYRIHDTDISLYAEPLILASFEKTINIVADSDYLWVCTPGKGCFEFLKGKFSRKYFDKTTVTYVFRDRENNMWFNTIGEGVYMLPAENNYVTNYSDATGLPGSNIISIAERNNAMWLGFTNGRVSKVTGNTISTFTLLPSENFVRVTSLMNTDDAMFCGTDNGIFIINDIKPFELQKSFRRMGERGAMKELFIDSKKNIFAAHADGVYKFIRGPGGYDYDNAMIPFPTRTFSITEYQNHILLATRMGLMEYVEGKTPLEFKTEVDFSTIRILDMKPYKDGFLLMATNGKGLYILKDNKLYQHLTTENGLSDNNCKRIFISGENVYLSTGNGIDILTNQAGRWNVSTVVSARNGLLSDNINEVVLSNGKIYAATEKGLSIMEPAAAYRKQFEGRVYITDVVTDSVKTYAEGSYSFKADIPRLLIRFAYPVFSSNNMVKLSYRLIQEKSDSPEWITSVNNEVEFSSLSPGKYTFQVKPNLKSVSEAGITSFSFDITPLWWQTTAARILFALLIASIIILVVRRRIQLQYNRQVAELRQLEAERSRIASDMHDDIGADLTQLSIWSGILKSSESQNKEVLSKITHSTNEVLQKMEQIIWALNSFHNQTTDLISYLREYASQYLESAGINLVFDTEGIKHEFEISAIQKRNIFLTVKELLHNTVKHSGAKNVRIVIYTEDSVLNVNYTDDGKGFTPREKEEGMGNVTVQKRMKEIDSTITVTSSPGNGFNAQLKIMLQSRLKKNEPKK